MHYVVTWNEKGKVKKKETENEKIAFATYIRNKNPHTTIHEINGDKKKRVLSSDLQTKIQKKAKGTKKYSWA